MLNNGVKRIIEQVVNPKIMQSIKPKIDEVVCEHFNISLKERQEKTRQKQLEQQQKQQQQQESVLNSPQSGGIMNLMSITFSSPPPGNYHLPHFYHLSNKYKSGYSKPYKICVKQRLRSGSTDIQSDQCLLAT